MLNQHAMDLELVFLQFVYDPKSITTTGLGMNSEVCLLFSYKGSSSKQNRNMVRSPPIESCNSLQFLFRCKTCGIYFFNKKCHDVRRGI